MNDTSNNDKLDWMYKGSNSLVDREEYLLGRSVDKTLEQLNAEEKEKKLGIVPPKNHVEHECIPPSIRDFNKIVQAEQVDISAKLQEDPLVAIKKREEEARRQFLQNPVQLKKLQEALKAQELKKKGKRKKSKGDSDSDIDSKIAKKLKYLKSDSGISLLKKKKKKSKESALDTILMHKFNELKDKLSQEDLNDILAGNVGDSDDEVEDKKRKSKKSSDEDSDQKPSKWKQRKAEQKRSRSKDKVKKTFNKRRDSSSDSERKGEQKRSRSKDKVKKTFNKRRDSSSDSESSEEEDKYKKRDKKENYNRNRCEYRGKNSTNDDKYKSKKHRKGCDSSSEDTTEEEARKRKDRRRRKNTPEGRKQSDHKDTNNSKFSRDRDVSQKREDNPDQDLENKILEKLRMLRKSAKSKRGGSSSDSDSGDKTVSKPAGVKSGMSRNESGSESQSDRGSESEDAAPKSRAFGLVKADGTKIALTKKTQEVKKDDKASKAETTTKLEKKQVKRLTEEEKQQKLREMMKNAEQRDKERSENLRRYREEDKREEKRAENFDKDFMHKQLLHSTKEATVESRIKSNLNNIQRSSRQMDTHFSRR